jgi:hypothetical protein
MFLLFILFKRVKLMNLVEKAEMRKNKTLQRKDCYLVLLFFNCLFLKKGQ